MERRIDRARAKRWARRSGAALLLCMGSLLSLGGAAQAAPAPAMPQVATHWEATGWGGGGFFWCCAAHPTNANILYLGGDVAGVYKSEDQGQHWRFINNGLSNYAVYSMAISKSNPEVLYVLTNDGLCRTSNGGESWQPLEETGKLGLVAQRSGSVRAIAVDPTNPDVVYAGGNKGRLCKSEDGGRTWQILNYLQAFANEPRPTPPTAFKGNGFLILKYESPAGDWQKNGRAERDFPMPGIDWSGYRKVTARLRVPKGAPPLQAQLVVQTGANWLWQQGQYVDAKPDEWTELSLDLKGLQNMQAVHFLYVCVRSTQKGYQGEAYLDDVELYPNDAQAAPVSLSDWEKAGDVGGWRANTKIADALYVTEIRQSADAGPREKGVIAAIAVAEKNPKRVFVATSEYGVLRSDDGGATWTALKTPKGACAVAVSPQDANVVYGAFGQEGVRRSTDGGATWTALNTGLEAKIAARDVAFDPADPDTVYCIANGNWKGYFYRSNDRGEHWTLSRMMKRDVAGNPTLPEETGTGSFPKEQADMSTMSGITVSGGAPRPIFLAGNWRNCLSTDGGKTWQERIAGADITCAYDVRFYKGRVYVTAMDEGSFCSDDGGKTWQQLAPRKYIEGVSGHQWRLHAWERDGKLRILTTVSPWAGKEVYPNGVMLSEDGGKTFRKVTQGLPDYLPRAGTLWGQSYPRALAVDPKNPDVIYLGMDGNPEGAGKPGGGIFRSKDGGATWERLPGQPEGRGSFFGLMVDPTDSRRLFWSCCGGNGGLYRSEDGGESWQLVFSNERWAFNAAVSPSGTLYCGGANLWRSEDHGRTWKQITHLPDRNLVVLGIEIDPQDEKRVWISAVTWGDSARGGVFRTTDGGATWAEITGDIPYRKPMVLRYNPDTKELWAAGVGLYKTGQ